jgi:hypothetical protein
MVFWIEKTATGQWTWKLRSAKTKAFIAACPTTFNTEAEVLAVINLMKLGVPEAVVINARPDSDEA